MRQRKDTWRAAAAPIIHAVLEAYRGEVEERVVKRALRDAYPFGVRAHWPYKVWCSEVRRQRGIRGKRKHHTQTRQLTLAI